MLVSHYKIRKRYKIISGGLHACSMALAAESATGILIGMNVRDTHLPLIKSMKVDFVRRCEGNINVEASITKMITRGYMKRRRARYLLNVRS